MPPKLAVGSIAHVAFARLEQVGAGCQERADGQIEQVRLVGLGKEPAHRYRQGGRGAARIAVPDHFGQGRPLQVHAARQGGRGLGIVCGIGHHAAQLGMLGLVVRRSKREQQRDRLFVVSEQEGPADQVRYGAPRAEPLVPVVVGNPAVPGEPARRARRPAHPYRKPVARHVGSRQRARGLADKVEPYAARLGVAGARAAPPRGKHVLRGVGGGILEAKRPQAQAGPCADPGEGVARVNSALAHDVHRVAAPAVRRNHRQGRRTEQLGHGKVSWRRAQRSAYAVERGAVGQHSDIKVRLRRGHHRAAQPRSPIKVGRGARPPAGGLRRSAARPACRLRGP